MSTQSTLLGPAMRDGDGPHCVPSAPNQAAPERVLD